MENDIRKFEADIKAFAKELENTINKAISDISETLYRKIVRYTPNATGRAQGNWNISVKTLDTSIDVDIQGSPDEMLARARVRFSKVKGAITSKDIVYIANSLYYVLYLENGTNRMTARGMLARSIEETKEFVSSALTR